MSISANHDENSETGDVESFAMSYDEALARRIILVIPVLNEEAYISECVTSLLGDDLVMQHVETVIVDGGSRDHTRARVDALQKIYPNLKWLDNPGKLQSIGVNIGAKQGAKERDILVRCDSHAFYPKHYVLDVARSMLARNCDSLVVPMDAVGTNCFQKANAWMVDSPLGSGGSAHRGGVKSGYVDHGHHAAFQREKFLMLGGYDESFSHNEDAEYDYRLAQSGGEIYLDATIRLSYAPRASALSLWKQYFNYGQGRARNVLKHGHRPRLRQMIPVIHCILLIAGLIIFPWHSIGLSWPIFYSAVLVLASLWLVVSKRSLCGLWGGVALGAMHTAWGLGFLKQLSFYIIRKKK